MQRLLFTSSIVILEDELAIHQQDLSSANTRMFLTCKSYLMEAKLKESEGAEGNQKAYLLSVACKMMVLMRTQSNPSFIYNNDDNKIDKAMLMLEIEKVLFNSLSSTKVLLKPRKKLCSKDDNLKKFEHVISEFLYRSQLGKKSTMLGWSNFTSEAIQSALTLMIADDGHIEKIYDFKKKDLTEKAQGKLLNRLISRSLEQKEKNIKSLVSDVKQDFSVPFQYLMENIACYDLNEEKEHKNRDGIRMMMSVVTRTIIAPNEPLLGSVSSVNLSSDPNLLCILASIAILQPDYPRKPFNKEIINNKKRNAASILLKENCALLKYYCSVDNSPSPRVEEKNPVPTQASGSSSVPVRVPKNEMNIHDVMPGRPQRPHHHGLFHGPRRGGYRIPIAEKRMRYDDEVLFE